MDDARNKGAAMSIGDRIAQATGGRRYCFVIMPYKANYHLFENVRDVVGETGLECIRADDIPASGEDLRSKIHLAIDNAAFIIADISEFSANVYYEIGYACAKLKEILLISRENADIPIDLKGLEIVQHSVSFTFKDDSVQFKQILRPHLMAQAGLMQASLLRDMIIPRQPSPSFILIKPKAPIEEPESVLRPAERRTYGDYLGVLGILRAFGSVYGEHVTPELISPDRVHRDVLYYDANLYFIGSPKVNPPVDEFLSEMQGGHSPNWCFRPPPGPAREGAYEMYLERDVARGERRQPDGGSKHGARTSDYGLIIRGPNPRSPGRMVTILAGGHSQGTGAACVAATNSRLIREIAEKLPDGIDDISHQERTLWALVHVVTYKEDDFHIVDSNIEVVDASSF